jgi:hypothetical protein
MRLRNAEKTGQTSLAEIAVVDPLARDFQQTRTHPLKRHFISARLFHPEIGRAENDRSGKIYSPHS